MTRRVTCPLIASRSASTATTTSVTSFIFLMEDLLDLFSLRDLRKLLLIWFLVDVYLSLRHLAVIKQH